jgi:hypothetical protein
MSVPDPAEAAERFVKKWSGSELSERAASHGHFTDLCRLIGDLWEKGVFDFGNPSC